MLLGLISYRLYLWHWPVLVFAGYALLSAPTPAETAGLILLSFALAWATYRFVELPFRRWMDERRVLIFRAGGCRTRVRGGRRSYRIPDARLPWQRTRDDGRPAPIG